MGTSILEDLKLAYRSIVKRSKEEGFQPAEEETTYLLAGTPSEGMPQKGSKVFLVFDVDTEYILKDYGTDSAGVWLVCLLEDKDGHQMTVGYPFVRRIE